DGCLLLGGPPVQRIPLDLPRGRHAGVVLQRERPGAHQRAPGGVAGPRGGCAGDAGSPLPGPRRGPSPGSAGGISAHGDRGGAGGGRALAIQADLGDPAEARALVTQAAEELGRVDVLVNNAGIADRADIWQIDEVRWATMMAVHVGGPFFASRAAGEIMIRQ